MGLMRSFVLLTCLTICLGLSIPLQAEPEVSDSTFFILPISSESKINSQVIEYRLSEQLSASGAVIKRDFLVTKNLRTFNYSLGRSLETVFAAVKPDFILHLDVKKRGVGKLEYIFNIFNSEKISVYNKSHVDFENIDLEPSIFQAWVAEFLGALPRSGTIDSVDEKVVKISFGQKMDADKLKGLDFIVTPIARKEEVSDSDALGKGVIVGVEGDFILGNLYESNSEIKPGHRIMLVKEDAISESDLKKGIELTNRSLVKNNPYVFSMRTCVMLPIIGEKEIEEGFFEDVQESLIDTGLCNFRESGEIKKILDSFGDKKEYLYNAQVLSTIAKKMSVGSIIRITLQAIPLGTKIGMEVVAENGVDVYYSRSKTISNKNKEFIIQILKSWLHLYTEAIPYHGLITKITQGEKVLVDFGGKNVTRAKTDFKIVKPLHLSIYNYNGVSHLVWKKEEIASGEFEEIQRDYSVGNILKVNRSEHKVAVGDWVMADKILVQDELVKDLVAQAKDRGTLNKGRLGVGAEISRLSSSRSGNSGNIFTMNADLTYYTDSFLNIYGEVKKDLSASTGFSAEGQSADLALGSSIVPSIEFFPMVLDFFAGYRYRKVSYIGLKEPFLGDLTYSGPYLGASLEFPIYNKFSLLGLVKYGPKDEATNTIKLIGSVKAASSRDLQLKGIYKFNKDFGLYASYIYQKYETRYTLDNIIISTNSSLTRFGFIMDF
jgi:hypothetical protein